MARRPGRPGLRDDGSGVGAVFFDLLGTLLELPSLIAECESAAPGRGSELAARWRTRQLEYSWLRTAMGTFVDFDRVTTDALGSAIAELDLDIQEPAVDLLASAFERLPVNPAAPGVLGKLRSAGIQTGVLTNASRRTLALALGRTGLDRVFDYRLSVDSVERFKPHPAVYGLAREASGLEAAQIGFVTANGWDAAGAASFGFRVAWLRSDPSSLLPAVGAPTPAIATWGLLVDLMVGESV